MSTPPDLNQTEEEQTQEVSPRVYEEYRRRSFLPGIPDGAPSRTSEIESERSLVAGDDGFINLSSNLNRPAADQFSDISPVVQRTVHISESQRFPKTPLTALRGSKHIDGGLDSVSTLPHNPLNVFNTKQPILGLSQVFGMTQAPTSPNEGLQQSDPISDRPSPDVFAAQYRLITNVSSPLATNHKAVRPRSQYVTMDDSQLARLALQKEKVSISVLGNTSKLDDDRVGDDFLSDEEQTRVKRRKYAEIDQQTALQLSRIKFTTPKLQKIDETAAIIPSSDADIVSSLQSTEDNDDEEAQTQIASTGPAVSSAASSRPAKNVNATPDDAFRAAPRTEKYTPVTLPDGTTIYTVANSQPSQNESSNDDLPPIQPSHNRSKTRSSQVGLTEYIPEESSLMTAPPLPPGITVTTSTPILSSQTTRESYHQAYHDLPPKDGTGSGSDISQRSSPPPLQTEISKEDTSSPTPSNKTNKENISPPNIQLESTHDKGTNVKNVAALSTESENTSTKTSEYETAPQVTEELSRPPGQNISATPTHPRLRTLTSIAADETPPKESQDIDTNIRIFNTQDEEFNNVLDQPGSSPLPPSRKRRRPSAAKLVEDHSSPPNIPQAGSMHQEENQPALIDENRPSGTSALQEITEITDKAVSTDNPSIGKRQQKTYSRKRNYSKGARKSKSSRKENLRDPASTLNDNAANDKDDANDQMQLVVDQNNSCPDPSSISPEFQNDQEQSSSSKPANPTRVLAKFKGSNNAYYPATCVLAIGKSPIRYKVRFDDGAVDVLDDHFVRRFELFEGDIVKIDIPKLRSKNFVVHGFKDQIQKPQTNETSLGNLTGDFYGHKTVSLAQKSRDSMPGDFAVDTETIEMPIDSVYITQLQWTKFENRPYTHPEHINEPCLSAEVLQSSPAEQIPSREKLLAQRGIRRSSSSLSEISTSRISNIFEGMAFAISYVKNDSEKSKIAKLIEQEGGKIITPDFESMFEKPKDDKVAEIQIASRWQAAGFTCLLADKHSRKAKYMQALALNIPCLSGTWIIHCVSSRKLLPWRSYLLPSGDSSVRGSATLSRNLTDYPVESAKLVSVTQSRAKLFDGASVLFVSSTSKLESRMIYIFLLRALGAKVERIGSLETASARLQTANEKWDWVCVGRGIEEAKEFLSYNLGKQRPKGRVGAREKNFGAQVVDDEYIIQSLILGELAQMSV